MRDEWAKEAWNDLSWSKLVLIIGVGINRMENHAEVRPLLGKIKCFNYSKHLNTINQYYFTGFCDLSDQNQLKISKYL
jgi:hypothetical protein